MGRPFKAGQNIKDGHRVVTVPPWIPFTVTDRPKPATKTTTTPRPTTEKATTSTITSPTTIGESGDDFTDGMDKEIDEELRPSTLLPIIMPLANNNWFVLFYWFF